MMSTVLDFGAKGDGRADDSDALQHAVEAGRGVVELPKGSFRITKPLVLDTTKSGFVDLRGAGGASQLIMDGAGPAIKVVGNHQGTATPSTVKPHTWQNERFPTLSNFVIVGKNALADGIELYRTMQATITKVLVRRCRDGIRLVERNRNFVLSDSHIYDNDRFGVFFDKCNLHQIIIHGNHISYNKRAGIKSIDGDVHNLQITGNDIEYNNRPGVDTPTEGGAEISFEAPKGIISEVTIASNTIQATIQPGGANIRIVGSSANWPSGGRLIAITGNVIGSQTRGIEISRCQRTSITGNTIYSSRDLSIAARQCKGMVVSANTFVWRGNDADPPQDGLLFEDCENGVISSLATQRLCYGSPNSGAGITLRRCTDMSISDCQILDPLVRGVEMADCQRCRVANNTVVDRREKAQMREAIRVVGGKDNLVQNNLVGGRHRPLISVERDSATQQANVEIGG